MSLSLSYLLRGGFMMIPLLISGLIGLTVIFERWYIIKFRLSQTSDLTSRVTDSLRKSARRSEAVKLASDEARGHDSPVGSVLTAGLRAETENESIEEIELAMQNQAELWIPQLEKRLDILDTIITAAPLMGLLGTITGMMSSFQVLSEKGVNEPNAITGGVSEALIATASGLVIALICLLAYNYFNHKVRDAIFQMESAGAQLVAAVKWIRAPTRSPGGPPAT